MATIVSTPFSWEEQLLDLFAGASSTPIADHAPNFGGPWDPAAGFNVQLDGAGGIFNAPAVGAPFWVPCLRTPVFAQAPQFVSGQVRRHADSGNTEWAGIGLRYTLPEVSDTGIFLLWESDGPAVLLYKVLANVDTVVHTYSQALAPGAALGLALFAVGNVYTPVIGGVAQTPITIAGAAGPGCAAAICDGIIDADPTTGTHLAQFLCGYQP